MSSCDGLEAECGHAEDGYKRSLSAFVKYMSGLSEIRCWHANWQRRPASCGIDISLSIATAVIISIWMACQHSGHGFGLPPQWSWILTAIQVLALGLVGQGHATGWLLGAAMQVSWICYAALTNQWGFVGGCILSAIVQTRSYYVSVKRRDMVDRQSCGV